MSGLACLCYAMLCTFLCPGSSVGFDDDHGVFHGEEVVQLPLGPLRIQRCVQTVASVVVHCESRSEAVRLLTLGLGLDEGTQDASQMLHRILPRQTTHQTRAPMRYTKVNVNIRTSDIIYSSIVIRRVSLGGGGGLFDGRGLWGPTKSRVQKDPSFLKTPKYPARNKKTPL